MQAPKSTLSNTPSSFPDRRRKNTTFISSASKSILRFDNIEQSLEMLKISLKKQSDRRNKLRKLLDKYTLIYAQEKKHVKQIKSSIIEMKDSNTACKLKLMLDPTILVQNSIKVQTRQFLCALMNTFYRAYAQNQENNETISNLNNTMTFLIKGISYNEDMIFLMQKSQINEQIQLESELLTERNRMKEELLKIKYIKEEHGQVSAVYGEIKQKNERKKAAIEELRAKLAELNEQAESLDRNIKYQEDLKIKCQDKIDIELMYHEKLGMELNKLTREVETNRKQSSAMLKKLLKGKIKEEELKMTASAKGHRKNRTVGEQSRQKIKFQLDIEFKNLRG